jgi:hypothetical protein
MASKTYHIFCLSEAIAPITYGMKTEGNEGIVARESVMLPEGRRELPILWANGLKHQLVREHAAIYTIGSLGLPGLIDERMLVWFFNGGIFHQSSGHDRTATRVDAARLFPMISLAGGCLPGQMLHAAAIISHGHLVCSENLPLIRAILPAGFELDEEISLRPAEEYVGHLQSYKHDGRKNHPEMLAPDARTLELTTGKENPMMPHAGECVLRGAVFAHRIILNDVTEIELGCLLDSIARWQHAGGAIGGQRARGNGAMKISLHVSPDADQAAARAAYLAHVESVRDEAVAFLNTAFAWAPPEEGKGKTRGRPKKNGAPDAGTPITAA